MAMSFSRPSPSRQFLTNPEPRTLSISPIPLSHPQSVPYPDSPSSSRAAPGRGETLHAPAATASGSPYTPNPDHWALSSSPCPLAPASHVNPPTANHNLGGERCKLDLARAEGGSVDQENFRLQVRGLHLQYGVLYFVCCMLHRASAPCIPVDQGFRIRQRELVFSPLTYFTL